LKPKLESNITFPLTPRIIPFFIPILAWPPTNDRAKYEIHIRTSLQALISSASGKITLPGLDADVAPITYKMVRVLIINFVVVIAYPFIPGSNSNAFKGISIFLGVLFSLGSTSAVANLVAGISLTYTSVEIISPHYTQIRDGNQTTLPPDYVPPAIRIANTTGPGEKK
jgi:hypothetical protein